VALLVEVQPVQVWCSFSKRPADWLTQRETVRYLAARRKLIGKTGTVQELNKINGLQSHSAASRAKLLRVAKETGFVRVKAGAPAYGS
jgi:hypothetical protein